MSSSPKPYRIVTLSGTLHSPSKTGQVIDAIVVALGRRAPIETREISVLDHGHQLIDAVTGSALDAALRDEFDAVRDADLLLVATPVYKGSYTGLLKLFVDFLSQDSLRGVPVLLVAVGGSTQHSLVIEHELRPLFGFFAAHTVPVGVYAQASDFQSDGTLTDALTATISTAIDAALPIVEARNKGAEARHTPS